MRRVMCSRSDRELKRPGDFEMFLGSEVEVKLYQPVNGSKTFVGELLAYDDGAVLIRSGKREDRFE